MPAATTVRTRYDELIAVFPLRPIGSDESYDAAVGVMDTLLSRDLDQDEDDYLHVLGFLIREYDEEHHVLPASIPADVLRDLMDEQGVTQADLAAATGIAGPNISAMLANRRGISKRCCKLFGEFFGVPSSRFLG